MSSSSLNDFSLKYVVLKKLSLSSRFILVLCFCFFSFLSFGMKTSEPDIPKKVATDPVALAKYLTKDAKTQKEKVEAIYGWITGNIKYDKKQLESPKLLKNQDAIKVLKSKKAVCYGYSVLFKVMCEAVGIPCEIIPGYVLDSDFIEGKYLHVDYHAWNAFKLDGKWYLCDPTWDSGHFGMDASNFTKWFYRVFRKKKKDEYPRNKKVFLQTTSKDHFMVSSDTFALRHLPSHPMWQLRTNVIPVSVFEKGPDTVEVYLSNESLPTQDYVYEIDEFQELEDEEKPVYLGEVGHTFNSRNTTIKTAEYANYLTVLGDKNVRKVLKQSPVAQKELAIFLKQKNDTIKKYLKLSQKNEKAAFKNNKAVEKQYFKEISIQHKSLDKSRKTLEKNVEKSKNRINKSTSMFNDLLKNNKKFDYQFKLKLDESFHSIEEEEDIQAIKHLRSRREDLNKVLSGDFTNEKLAELLKATSYALEYTKYSLSAIKVNSHAVDEVLSTIYFKEDSLLQVANSFATDQIVYEAFNKLFIDSCKALIRDYKALSRTFKAKNDKKYNRLVIEFEQEINDITRIMLIYAVNGKKYNAQYVQYLTSLKSILSSLKVAQNKQTKTEEERQKEILNREELRNKRAEKFYESIEKLLKESEKFVKQSKKLMT